MSTLEEKKARAKRMGIPLPITQISESSVAAPVTAANADRHARLAAIRSGANKKGMQDLVNSKKSSSQSFQGIPESTQKKNPNNPNNKVSPGKSVAPRGFEAPANDELSAIDAMFGGSGGSVAAAPTQGNTNLSVDSIGPTFNPAALLAQKNAQAANVATESTQEAGTDYLQYAQYQAAPQGQTVSQENFDFQNMKTMMQEIAKQTISEVLNEYTEKQKNKLTYENYMKTKDGAQVIKSQGKFYKLTPVKITKG